jgi:hypothetical protein
MIRLGLWLWGAITVVLAVAALAIVILSAFYLSPAGELVDAPQWFAGMYLALKNNGSVVAGIVGFSTLAWSFIAASRPESGRRRR